MSMRLRWRRACFVVGLTLAMSTGGRAETVDAAKAVASAIRPFYATALRRTGSELEPGSAAWEDSLAASASALLAAKPDDCALVNWLMFSCGMRSLITPSQAMAPSLLAGDTFLSVEVSATRPIRRGDVLAFRDPRGANARTATIYISRLIGLPGERLRLREGFVEIDGSRVVREPAGDTVRLKGEGDPLVRFTERLPSGRTYSILRPVALSDRASLLDDMPEIVVPEGHFFMLSDNRLNAVDSRLATTGQGPGMPTAANIVGIVSVIYISRDPSRIGRRP